MRRVFAACCAMVLLACSGISAAEISSNVAPGAVASWIVYQNPRSGVMWVSCAEQYKGTPLHELVRMGELGTVEMMTKCVSGGVDINGRDQLGNTALHQAVLMGNLCAVSNLLDLGCATSLTNASGRTPLFIALADQSTNNPHAKLLMSRGARITTSEAMCIAAMLDDVATLAALVDSDPSLLKSYENGTPLHYAARAGALNAAAYLVAHGVDPNARGERGSTPLHSAKYGRKAEMVEWLVTHGASMTNRNDAGCTPMDIRSVEEMKKMLRGETQK